MCTGDPVRRAGNEFMFQMMAYQNIQILNNYNIKKIVTACPHCFNTLKNEYPELGGNYEVIHHSTFLQGLIDEGKITMKEGGTFKGKKITYHDSCYKGRVGIYEVMKITPKLAKLIMEDGNSIQIPDMERARLLSRSCWACTTFIVRLVCFVVGTSLLERLCCPYYHSLLPLEQFVRFGCTLSH